MVKQIEIYRIHNTLAAMPAAERRLYRISENFTWVESYSGKIHSLRPYRATARSVEPPEVLWDNVIEVFLRLQKVADYLKLQYDKYIPIAISSFWREKYYNDHMEPVKGSKDSQHILGKAVDSHPIGLPTMSNETYDRILAIIGGFNGGSAYSWGCHADIREEITSW